MGQYATFGLAQYQFRLDIPDSTNMNTSLIVYAFQARGDLARPL